MLAGLQPQFSWSPLPTPSLVHMPLIMISVARALADSVHVILLLLGRVSLHFMDYKLYMCKGGGVLWVLKNPPPPPPLQTKKGPLECMKRSTRMHKKVHYNANLLGQHRNRGSEQVAIQSARACMFQNHHNYRQESPLFHAKNLSNKLPGYGLDVLVL